MKKGIFFIFLICSNLLISEGFLIKPKGYLDIQTGEIIRADLLIRNGKIIEIGKIKTNQISIGPQGITIFTIKLLIFYN